MFYRSVDIQNFRNIENIKTCFNPGINIFIGLNGQGKTNLLESLYLSTQGESFRYGDLNKFVHYSKKSSQIKTELTMKELDYSLKVILEDNKKQIYLNEKKSSSLFLKKNFHCVIFSPESLASIKEGADHRRQLLDDLLTSIHPEAVSLLQSFRKIHRSRNKVLREICEFPEKRNQMISVLESLQPIYLRVSIELVMLRIQAIQEILVSFNEAMSTISNKSNKKVDIHYLISSQNAKDWNLEKVKNALQKRHEELYEAELSAGTSLVGPHKHDLVFLYAEKDSRFFCSQGQQRALILAFKMAQIVYHRKVNGIYPVMMLDDVLSELDQEKRQALILFLHDIKTQTFITTTDLSLPESLSDLSISVSTICEGRIIE